jgi:hypothetical protein
MCIVFSRPNTAPKIEIKKKEKIVSSKISMARCEISQRLFPHSSINFRIRSLKAHLEAKNIDTIEKSEKCSKTGPNYPVGVDICGFLSLLLPYIDYRPESHFNGQFFRTK